jgi:hypothetical protein
MSDPRVTTVVNALLRARHEQRLAEASEFSETLTSAEQAYAVQAGVADALQWYGAEGPMHWKSGGASRQATLTHAPLPPAGVWKSPASAGAFAFGMRGIEAEVALRLGEAVDAAKAATLDETSASALIEAMAVSIEIVDSRWTRGHVGAGAAATGRPADAWRAGAGPVGALGAARLGQADLPRVHWRAAGGPAPRHSRAGRSGLGRRGMAAPRHVRRPDGGRRHGPDHRHLGGSAQCHGRGPRDRRI